MGCFRVFCVAVFLLAIACHAQDLVLHRVANVSEAVAKRQGQLRGDLALYDGTALGKSVSVVQVSKLSVDDVTAAVASSSNGILFVVDASSSQDVLSALEKEIVATEVAFPMFFVDGAADSTKELIAKLGSHSSPLSALSLAINTPVTAAKSLNVPVFASTFGKPKKGKKAANAKTNFVVISHFDANGVAPSFPSHGVSSGASAALEIARVLGSSNLSSVNAMGTVVAAGGGRLSYRGAAQWLSDQNSNFVDNLDFVVALEDLVTPHNDGKTLYLHMSVKPEEAEAKKWVDSIVESGKKFGITIEVVVKKISIKSREMRWAHEPFAFRKILSATLSARKTAPPQSQRSQLASQAPSTAVLGQQVEALVAFLGAAVGKELDAVKAPSVAAWEKFHSRYSRPSTGGASDAVLQTYATTLKKAGGSFFSKTYENDAKKLGLSVFEPAQVNGILVESFTGSIEQLLLVITAGYIFVTCVMHLGFGGAMSVMTFAKKQKAE